MKEGPLFRAKASLSASHLSHLQSNYRDRRLNESCYNISSHLRRFFCVVCRIFSDSHTHIYYAGFCFGYIFCSCLTVISHVVVVAVERTSIHEYSCLPLRSSGLSVWQQHCIKPVTHVATDLVVSARSTRSHRTLSLSLYLIPSLLLTINCNFVRFLDTYNISAVDFFGQSIGNCETFYRFTDCFSFLCYYTIRTQKFVIRKQSGI